MKKILITSNTSWFIYNFFRSSITEFMQDKNHIIIAAPRDETTNKLIELGCEFHEIDICRSGINIIKELKTIKQLHSIHKSEKPDILLNFTQKINIYSTILGKINSIPSINSVAGIGSIFTEKGLKSWLGKSLLKISQPLAHHVIFQNTDDYDLYINKRYTTPKKSSCINGIGVNLKDFLPYESKNDNVVRFILVARMLYTKGVEVFVEAAKVVEMHYSNIQEDQATKFEFSLLGFIDPSHPQHIPLKQLQQWNDDTIVNYLGETNDIYSTVKEQDCVVLPSYYREGLPQSLIEAAAMAKPIITTNNVGCRDTVDDNITGFIVTSESISELANAMIKTIELSHEERLEFGRLGRIKAEENFCHLKISKHYLDVIKNILK